MQDILAEYEKLQGFLASQQLKLDQQANFNQQLKSENKFLQETIRLLKQKPYLTKSEKLNLEDLQARLFELPQLPESKPAIVHSRKS